MRPFGKYLALLSAVMALLPTARAEQQKATERVYADEHGVIRWTADDREVALFGANYSLPSACDYRAAGYVGADRKNSSNTKMKSKILSLLLLLPAVVFAAPLPDLPHGWSESYVYANGIRIHYYRGGIPAPGKPVILAVHGVMDTGLTWASVGMKLQKNYDLYMLDTRGHQTRQY